ncbi:MAG: class I SAM-dependent methyltransferase [Planctomycetes bacterium]|nr:class I SAM-dependent methyltransferase [Planctomycetota bacterium]
MEVIEGNIYDYPKYYDVLFGADWKAEYDFLLACFDKHVRRPVRRVFEPACGTGRLLVKLAGAGMEVAGNDLNPKAVEYCNARLVRHGFAPTARLGDMSDFKLRPKAHAAFNTINSFRHLPSEQAAENHLRCVAAALVQGGVYVLGLHLTPAGTPLCDEESWSARRGHLSILSRMWSIRIDRRRRKERVGFTFDVYTPLRQFRLTDELDFRTYTAAQFRRLLARVPELEPVETYDFAYDIDEPARVTSQTEDVVFVLRKR